MKNIIVMFFSTKYFPDENKIKKIENAIKNTFKKEEIITIIDGDLSILPDVKNYDSVIIIPCSGSVQPNIIEVCDSFNNVVMFSGYVDGNFESEITDMMLYANAGPTFMDSYGVLKRIKNVDIKKTTIELNLYLQACNAVEKIKNARIGMIGNTEPWVISVSKNLEIYEKQIGVKIEQIQQNELLETYKDTDKEESQYIYDYYKNNASQICEPTETDLINTARMAQAMIKIIKKYQLSGIAIACFDLIANSGVNPCVGVSYINGETPYFAACEGDIDSAITMLFIRTLTGDNPWMANPSLQKDDSVNFAHCTAPISISGEKQKYILRNHHETGVGVSLQVQYKHDLPISLFRYSGVENSITINRGYSVEGRYEPNCRTQMRVELENYNNYIENVIGCHQIMALRDVTSQMEEFAKIMNIRVK